MEEELDYQGFLEQLSIDALEGLETSTSRAYRLVQDSRSMGKLLAKRNRRELEKALAGVLNGNGDAVGAAFSGIIGRAVQGQIERLTVRQRVSSRESDRSLQAVGQFRLSRSQQSAEMLRALEQGRRNI